MIVQDLRASLLLELPTNHWMSFVLSNEILTRALSTMSNLAHCIILFFLTNSVGRVSSCAVQVNLVLHHHDQIFQSSFGQIRVMNRIIMVLEPSSEFHSPFRLLKPTAIFPQSWFQIDKEVLSGPSQSWLSLINALTTTPGARRNHCICCAFRN